MPQIRCPRCGLTINLENRRELDVKMITGAVKQEAKTFTELLRITSLPKKTLNLRLKELCRDGVLVKAKGVYQLNGHPSPKKSFTHPLSSVFSDRRIKSLAVLLILIVGFPALSYVLANLSPTTPYIPPKEQEILGTLTVVIEVRDVKDLWAWQVLISYNTSELKLLDWKCGEIIEVEEPFKCPAREITFGNLLIGATLEGNKPGVNVEGNGTLALITFGCYVENPTPPQLIIEGSYPFQTELLNSKLQTIPITDKTLNIKILS